MKKILLAIVAFFMTVGMAFAAVDINSADEKGLDAIKGVGPAKAKLIVDERKKNGPYKSLDDVATRVKGIGEKTVAGWKKDGSVTITRAGLTASDNINDSGRRLMQFGPEGFRSAPKGHRLVILMGAEPEAVEQAFSSALGTVAMATSGQSGNAVDREALKALLDMGRDKARLQALLAAP